MNSLEKFVIKFDAQHIPVNFDKWIKLDTDKYKDDEFRLNDYKSVVIKSTDSNILFRIGGGVKYVIKQNMVYFPFILIYHDCIIKLSSKISVYVNNDKSESKFDLVHDQKVDLLSELEPINIGDELHKLMMELSNSKCHISTIFSNLEIHPLDEDVEDVEDVECCLCMYDNYGICTKKAISLYVDFDTPYNIEKFYYEYQTLSKELNVDDAKIIDNINLIDKYYQLEVIKIYKYIDIRI